MEVWHFDAGTGCTTPPGDCGFGGPSPETNEVEFDGCVVSMDR